MKSYNRTQLEAMKVAEMIKLLPEGHGLYPTSKKTVVIDAILKSQEIEGNGSEEFETEQEDETPQPKSEQNDSLYELAKQAEKEKYKPDSNFAKDKKYIAKLNNYRLKPTGYDKDGYLMRYVVGYDTLDIEVQNRKSPNGVREDYIMFVGNGNQDATYSLAGFGSAHSMIVVPKTNVMLQKYIESHKLYGKQFVEYDEKSIKRARVEAREKADRIGQLVSSADRNSLLIPLTHIYNSQGSDGFSTLQNKELFELKELAYNLIDNNPNEFYEASRSARARFSFLGALAVDMGILKLTSDKREIKWANNTSLAIVQIGRTWYDTLEDILSSAEGVSVTKRLEVETSFSVAGRR